MAVFPPQYPSVYSGPFKFRFHDWEKERRSCCLLSEDEPGSESWVTSSGKASGMYVKQKNAVGMTDDLASQFIGWKKG